MRLTERQERAAYAISFYKWVIRDGHNLRAKKIYAIDAIKRQTYF